MVVKIHIALFEVMALCSPVGRYQRLGTTYCLHLQGLRNVGSHLSDYEVSCTLPRSLLSLEVGGSYKICLQTYV
jgi:hypothetical protein